MSTPSYPAMSTTATPRNVIDLKANGEVSRMRNHKGNMPSLPQTKYCTLCPAKFTRTTHLNRHLRSHTNERLYRCTTCNAEFTRSDLLTRHKRTCGDSANAHRSRRKSCQACAESKVKCNLQYPCSKCSSRGKDCVFINDPEASRNKRNAKKAQRSTSPKSPTEENAALSALGNGSQPSFSIPASPVSTISTVTSPTDLENPFPLLTNSSASASSGSSNSSPRTDFFESQQEVATPYDVELEAINFDNQLNRFLSTSTYEPYVDHATVCAPQPHDLPWLDGGNILYPPYNDEGYSFASVTDQFASAPVEFAGLASHLHQHSHQQLPHQSHSHQQQQLQLSLHHQQPQAQHLQHPNQHLHHHHHPHHHVVSAASVMVNTISSLGSSPQLGAMPIMVDHTEPSTAELEQYRALVHGIPTTHHQWC